MKKEDNFIWLATNEKIFSIKRYRIPYQAVYFMLCAKLTNRNKAKISHKQLMNDLKISQYKLIESLKILKKINNIKIIKENNGYYYALNPRYAVKGSLRNLNKKIKKYDSLKSANCFANETN